MEFNNTPVKFPQLDRNQVRRHLELLGYQENDNIFLRFFYPTNDPRKDLDKGRKSNRLNWQEIEKYQQQGRGTYFVINGGGHKNKDVKFGRAIFIEHDHLAKEVQQELWKELGLPQPTFQIDTGGKSIHSYWRLSKPITVNQWRELQLDLLEYTDGDRSIKNPARVMRLAGAWHISINEKGEQVYNQSRIISDSGQKYSYEELRAMVPDFQTEEPLSKEQEQGQTPSSPNPQSPIFYRKSIDQIQIPVPEPIPLLECCRKEVRQWVVSGIPQGQRRNDTVGGRIILPERQAYASN